MSTEMVSLGLRDNATLPMKVVLPASIREATGVERRFMIANPDMEVPEAVREWMRSDKRYMSMFATEDELEARAQAKSAKKSARAAKAADKAEKAEETPETPAEEEGWYSEWSVAQLRSYAQDHGVELTSKDRSHAAVEAKLEEAGLPKGTGTPEVEAETEPEPENKPESEPEESLADLDVDVEVSKAD